MANINNSGVFSLADKLSRDSVRLKLWFALGALGIFALFTTQDYFALKSFARRDAQARAAAAAGYMSGELARLMRQGQKRPVVEALRAQLAQPQLEALLVRDKSGQLYAGMFKKSGDEPVLYTEPAGLPEALMREGFISQSSQFVSESGETFVLECLAKDFRLDGFWLKRLGYLASRTLLLEVLFLAALFLGLDCGVFKSKPGGNFYVKHISERPVFSRVDAGHGRETPEQVPNALGEADIAA